MLHRKKYVKTPLLHIASLGQKVAICTTQSEIACTSPVTFMHYLRLHTGATGENAAVLTSACVHVAAALPTSSKPIIQL